MKTMKYSLGLLALSMNAWAGISSSGGGNASVCFDSSDTVLTLMTDLRNTGAELSKLLFAPKYLSKIQKVRSYDLMMAEMPVGIDQPKLRREMFAPKPEQTRNEIIQEVIGRISAVNSLGDVIQEVLLNEIPEHHWILAPGVAKIDDGNFQADLPAECIRSQIALRRGDKVLYSGRLFSLMSPLDQAALVIHEAVYKIAMDKGGATNAAGTQEVVGMLFASNQAYEQEYKGDVFALNRELDDKLCLTWYLYPRAVLVYGERGSRMPMEYPTHDALDQLDDESEFQLLTADEGKQVASQLGLPAGVKIRSGLRWGLGMESRASRRQQFGKYEIVAKEGGLRASIDFETPVQLFGSSTGWKVQATASVFLSEGGVHGELDSGNRDFAFLVANDQVEVRAEVSLYENIRFGASAQDWYFEPCTSSLKCKNIKLRLSRTYPKSQEKNQKDVTVELEWMSNFKATQSVIIKPAQDIVKETGLFRREKIAHKGELMTLEELFRRYYNITDK